MEELKESWGTFLKWFPLIIFSLLAIIGLEIWGHDTLHDWIMRQCPRDTFLSGEQYRFWEGQALSVLGVILWFGVMAVTDRYISLPESYRSKFSLPWRRTGWMIFAICLTISLSASLLTSVAQFCLSERSINYRLFPWQPFDTYAWTDLQQISAVCQAGGKYESDLQYVLTMKDSHTIDIADAFPNLKGLFAFDHQLVGLTFSFEPDVRKGCPSYLADWVGEKP